MPDSQVTAPVEDTPGVALSDEELTTAAPDVLANSLSEYVRAWWQRIKNGESGALPVIIGLIAIVIFFQIERSQFLTDGNLVNLLIQAAPFVMFGAAETFVLLLSEIDLSIGYGAGVGAFVIAELIAAPVSLPWWLGILGGLAAMAVLGLVQGALIARLGLPSFVVTLGGQLAFLGLMLDVANWDKSASSGGVIDIAPSSPVYKLVNSQMSPTLGWILLVVCVVAFAALRLRSVNSRRAAGLTAPPMGVTWLTIAGVAILGIVLMVICNVDRGNGTVTLEGMPYVIPFVFVVLLIYSFMMDRTRIGRYVYAVGNNKEAARRAGIKVERIVIFAFVMAGITAGLAGLVYESNAGSMSTDIPGGQLVLFAVAAAVIGGTSLFGGRGKIMNALLGGFVIATVYNGLGLMGAGPATTDIATAVVLILAVSIDALVRRRATSH